MVVEGRGAGQQVVEDGHGRGVVLVGPAAEHGILHAEFDRLIAEADGLAAGRAGRGRRDDPAGDAEHLGDIHGRGVHHGFQIINGADVLTLI